MAKEFEDKTEIQRLINAELVEALERTVRESFRMNRGLWCEIIRAELRLGEGAAAAAPAEDEGEWTRIESLSRLRASVGGRFDSLKRRWLGAGFPLKEHRGDKPQPHKCDPSGWRELAAWIGEQGYESRLAEAGCDFLFEIRKINS